MICRNADPNVTSRTREEILESTIRDLMISLDDYFEYKERQDEIDPVIIDQLLINLENSANEARKVLFR